MYRITRFYAPYTGKSDRVIKTVDTLEEAQEWCQRGTTHGANWFDGYQEVSR